MKVGGKRQFGAILLSRQARRPCRTEAWVRQAEQAILYLRSRDMGVVSSLGQSTWELITSLASLHKLPLRLVLPPSSRNQSSDCTNEHLYQFDLSPHLVEFVPTLPTSSYAKSDKLAARDKMVMAIADLVLTVSIRSGGSMERLAQVAAMQGKCVDSTFQTAYQLRKIPLCYTVPTDTLSEAITKVGSSYLIHWTRSANHHWPGERSIEYYRDVAHSDRYCRTGFDTLKRILSERCLRSSARHMPRGFATVAFSGLPPVEVLPLMRWRARFGEMSFEPYGIGIRREVALASGISPVSYITKRSRTCATPWLCQSVGQRTDWRQEQEYRHLGDLNLERFDRADLQVITLHPHEAREISHSSGLSAVSFY